MKKLLCLFALMGLPSMLRSEAEPAKQQWDPAAKYTKAMYVHEIDGTSLRHVLVISRQPSTGCRKEECTIGLLKQPNPDAVISVVPAVTLPPLTNDTYEVELKSGVLYVREKRSSRQVLQLNLKNLAPNLLEEPTKAEDGAGQPATAPKSKLEAKEKLKSKSEVPPQ